MANRYWVGEDKDGNELQWDASAGSKWATTAGGAGGAPVPTVNDDVFIGPGQTVVLGSRQEKRGWRQRLWLWWNLTVRRRVILGSNSEGPVCRNLHVGPGATLVLPSVSTLKSGIDNEQS